MQANMRRRLLRGLGLALGAGLFGDKASARQAGHGTLPTTGAAARSSLPTAEREEDLVLARIEGLREALRETGKRYKKLKQASRATSRAELLEALARTEADATALRELVDRAAA
jgi:uncharacterized membrane protein